MRAMVQFATLAIVASVAGVDLGDCSGNLPEQLRRRKAHYRALPPFDRTVESQRLLAKLGLYTQIVDGKWGPRRSGR